MLPVLVIRRLGSRKFARRQAWEILRNVVGSTCSRRDGSKSCWSRHSHAAPDVTSIALSRPKPTSETEPAINRLQQTFKVVVPDGGIVESRLQLNCWPKPPQRWLRRACMAKNLA